MHLDLRSMDVQVSVLEPQDHFFRDCLCSRSFSIIFLELLLCTDIVPPVVLCAWAPVAILSGGGSTPCSPCSFLYSVHTSILSCIIPYTTRATFESKATRCRWLPQLRFERC
jgi:hypothetical protein